MYKCTNLDLREVGSLTSNSKKLNRCRSFHFRYLELCRAKNMTPLPDIRTKNNATSVLEFFGDKLSVNDWLLVVEALYYDQVLQTLCIRLRKTFGMVLDHLDSEKKAKLFRQKPVIFTKFVFAGVVEAISNCIEFNKNLRVLNLEGLPLNDKYVESIAKALSTNDNLKEISFQRSNIYDKGCEAICNTIKYLEHVEKLNLSECELTTKGAECVADMIKIQKISRYTEGWQKSLRYRDVDPDTIPGLRSISLARNPNIGDDGIKSIVEVLKEDVWIKVIDMENCGLTDRAANMILDCLEINNYIIDFNIRNNTGISKFLQRSIRDQLGKDDEEQKLLEGQSQLISGPNGVVVKRSKVTVANLKEQLKTLEEQLAFERVLRKKAEQLNEKLNQQIIEYENQLEQDAKSNIPEGYVIVKNESLQSIIRERNDFQKLVTSGVSESLTPRCSVRSSSKVNTQIVHPNYENDDNETECESQNYEAHQNSPVTSTNSQAITQKELRKTLKVRKVKSEIKYTEPNLKDSNKKRESKSDHEFTNDNEFQIATPIVHFETNIGDTLANNSSRSENSSITITNMPNLQELKDKKASYYYNHNNDLYTTNPPIINNWNEDDQNDCQNSKSFNNNCKPNKNYYENLNKFDLDDISMPTTRSLSSDICSSDSDTLRNEKEFQPMKVFIRRSKGIPSTPMPLTGQHPDHCPGDGSHNNNNNRTSRTVKSPRSVFLGLCEE